MTGPTVFGDPLAAEAPPSRRVLIVMAVLAAANVLLFMLIAEDVLNGGGLVSHDQAVLAWFVDHRTQGLIHAAKVVSTLGSFVSLAIIAGLLGGWLWRRGWHLGLAAAPLVSLVLASLASTTAKAIFGRARPPVSVHAEHVSLKAFPSGHATDTAAFFLSAALVLAITVAHRRSAQVALIATGIGLAALVGLSRLVLGVHWLSDVVAGWALGSAFALAVVAIWWQLTTHHRVGTAKNEALDLPTARDPPDDCPHGSASAVASRSRPVKATLGVLVLVVSLTTASLAACSSSGSSNSAQLSQSTLSRQIDPSIAPAPGAVAPVPVVSPDPPDLASEIGLPSGSADQITFYFTLPTDDVTLVKAAEDMATPGTGSYRHFFTNYADAARTYGAKAADIEAAVKSVRAKGLSVTVDPSRTFVRVFGTAEQWQKVLGKPLTMQEGSPDAPFDVYDLPTVPRFDKLTYVGAGATVYDAAIDAGNRQSGASTANAAAINGRARASANAGSAPPASAPWPVNTGTPPANTCLSGTSLATTMYAPSQIATAYDTRALQETALTKAVRVSVIDLGGGFSDADIQGAARCFGYVAPTIEVQTGDGVSGNIRNNNDETELDLQTMAPYVPGGTIQLVEATNGPASLLDATSRMLGDPAGFPDGGSISYAQCAVQESQGDLALIHAVARVIILGIIVGSSVFVAAGDWGSTTCGNDVKGTSQSFAASAPWATAVGGTRLILNAANQRADELVWNDQAYGVAAAGGGGVSKVFQRPWYQNEVTTSKMRVVPDFAALADITPGWPLMLNGRMQSIGGTSGSSPFAMAKLALLSASERLAGRPRVGFVNPWFYQLYQQHPELFYDVVSGNNDLNGVGCCTAAKGFDEASGLGVPDFAEIAQHLPSPSP